MKNWIALVLGILVLIYALGRPSACLAPAGGAAAPPLAAVAEPARVSAQFGDRVVLRGVLPDGPTRARLVSKAREQYGAERVVDELVVNAAASEAAWTTGDGLFAVLQAAGAARAEFNGRTLRLEGAVDSDAARTRIAEQAARSLREGAAVENALTVRGTSQSEARIADILKAKNVEFVSNRDVMTPGGEAVMREVLEVLRRAPASRWEVAGHTDSLGDPQHNLTLSEARAATVIRWLSARGLDASRFVAKGYGAARPISDNGTPAGRQRNRRIEFTQIGG